MWLGRTRLNPTFCSNDCRTPETLLSDGIIEHIGHHDPEIARRKGLRYLQLIELDLAEHPDDPIVQFQVGRTLNSLGRLREALDLIKGAAPRIPAGRSVLGRLAHRMITEIYRKLGDFTSALQAAERGLELYPGDIHLIVLKADLAVSLGYAAEAAQMYRRLLALPFDTVSSGRAEVNVDTSLRRRLSCTLEALESPEARLARSATAHRILCAWSEQVSRQHARLAARIAVLDAGESPSALLATLADEAEGYVAAQRAIALLRAEFARDTS